MQFTYDATMFQDFFEHDFTYINGFMRNVSRFADQSAMICPLTGRNWTYRTLNEDVNRLANALQKDGVGKNDVVMYMLLNSAEYIFCYLAPQKIGAVNCPINYRQAAGEIALMIDDSCPKVFVYDEEFRETALQALRLARHKPQTIIVADLYNKAAAEKGEVTYRDYVSGQSDENPKPSERLHIYDETTRLYTSGTTNCPKAVPMNSINEVLSAHNVMMGFPLNSTDRTMNMTPWFHRGGLHECGPTPTFYAGGSIVIIRDFNPRRCQQYTEKYKVTYLIGVPSIIAMFARAQKNKPVDLSTLRGIVTMGAPFERAACEEYRKLLHPNIFNGYGTTETFVNTLLHGYDLPEMSGSVGQACTDDDVRVVHADKEGHAEPDDLVATDGSEIGEIIIKSPASACCYLNNPKLTAEKFYQGFLYTGDIGTWNSRKFITVAGRKDDMIVSVGENIFPAQIEAILEEHPKVLEAGVIGVKDELRGEAVAAYIVPADDSLTVEELKKYCANHVMLSAYKRPRFYYFVKELPHTATGKLMHNKLRELSKMK